MTKLTANHIPGSHPELRMELFDAINHYLEVREKYLNRYLLLKDSLVYSQSVTSNHGLEWRHSVIIDTSDSAINALKACQSDNDVPYRVLRAHIKILSSKIKLIDECESLINVAIGCVEAKEEQEEDKIKKKDSFDQFGKWPISIGLIALAFVIAYQLTKG